MATLILKNTAITDKLWGGITVLASNQYTLQEVDRLRLLSDPTFLADLTGGVAVINDGTNNLSASIGLLALKLQSEEGRFNNTTNGFIANNIQAAIEEARNQISIPSTDQCVYVSKSGNDTTGNGSFGKPYLTIAKAFTSITDSSPTKRYTISVSPGDYAENLTIKANVFVKGSGPIATRITGTAQNINDATWNVSSADNRSGFQDITLNGTCTWDFSAQAGNTDGKLYFYNVRSNATWTFTALNAINQAIARDCDFFGTWAQIGMNAFVSNSTWQSGNITVNSSTASGIPAIMTIACGRITGNITATWTSNSAVTVNLAAVAIGSSTVLTASGASCTVNANDASLPVPANRSIVSSAVLNRINDNFANGLLSATTNVTTSASTAPSAGMVLVANSSTDATWQYLSSSIGLADFGDGSDGDLSISSGVTTLTRTMYYNNLTISGTASINANGYKIYVKGTLTNSVVGGITRIPNNGTNGSGQTNGNGGAALTENDCGPGLAGQAGSQGGGSNSTGVAGNNAGTAEGYGNAGGASGSAGSTGTAGSAGTYTHVPERIVRHDHIYKLDYKNGGQGGAGGAGGAASLLAAGGGGGGGGSGGGVLIIFARTINNTGSFTCLGGNGGNGGAAPSGNSRGGGGGGGGGGGQIFIVCLTATSIGTLNVNGGNGGTGGAGNGSGAAGGNGSAGSTGRTTVYTASTSIWTVT